MENKMFLFEYLKLALNNCSRICDKNLKALCEASKLLKVSRIENKFISIENLQAKEFQLLTESTQSNCQTWQKQKSAL